MATPNPMGQASPVEILAQWEGPAIHEPGVLFDEQQVERLAAGSDVAELVAWLAVTSLPGVPGDAVSLGIRAKVLGVLPAWRRRFGQAKMDEIKQQLFAHMQQYSNHRKITDLDLRQRLERLFEEVPA